MKIFIFIFDVSHWMIVNFSKSNHRNKKLKSVFVSYSFVSCPATNRRAGNCPISVAFSSSTWRIEPSRRAKTGGTPGTSWYWRILSSRVSPLWVELGSYNWCWFINDLGIQKNLLKCYYYYRIQIMRIDIEWHQLQSLKWWRINNWHIIGCIDAVSGKVAIFKF